jgi:hypothetical protein
MVVFPTSGDTAAREASDARGLGGGDGDGRLRRIGFTVADDITPNRLRASRAGKQGRSPCEVRTRSRPLPRLRDQLPGGDGECRIRRTGRSRRRWRPPRRDPRRLKPVGAGRDGPRCLTRAATGPRPRGWRRRYRRRACLPRLLRPAADPGHSLSRCSLAPHRASQWQERIFVCWMPEAGGLARYCAGDVAGERRDHPKVYRRV